MAIIAGKCEFSETNKRARVFALCELQNNPVLVPMAMVGDHAIRGMQCSSQERKLVLRVGSLPRTLVRAYIGLRVNRGLDLSSGGPYGLTLRLPSGATSNMPMPTPPPGLGNRYALLAVLTQSDSVWNVGRLVAGAEYYVDRQALGKVRPVPSWWTRYA